MIKLRWYQSEAAEALFDAVDGNSDVHPIAVIPTAGGKSYTLCEFVNLYLSKHPTHRVLVLSHVAEILEQDHASLEKYFPDTEIGLYSAGLKSKTIHKVTVAGIQSVYNKQALFSTFDIVIIDECHLVPMKNNTMYRSFLDGMDANFVGLTATHFRLGHGYLHKGKGALFNKIAYDLSAPHKFNRLVNEGYLSKLITKNTLQKWEADEQGMRTTAGDFNQKDMSMAFDRDTITNAAVEEIIKFGKNYKLWLIFAIDIKHAEHIAEAMTKSGIKTACIHSKMEGDRRQTIDDIKAGKYRAVVNVDVLTTGFDVPGIDLIAMLRPTQSPVIHVQTIGRGLRVIHALGFPDTDEGRRAAIEAGPKQHCLILDFAGNTERLGPINDVLVKEKGEGKGTGEAPVKECPECLVLHHPSIMECDNCGHKFIRKEKIEMKASNAEVVVMEKERWLNVTDVNYSIHQKRGKQSSLRVIYKTGITGFSEWVCYDHKGYAGHSARNWVNYRFLSNPKPKNLAELYKNADKLMKPTQILVDNSGKFPAIKDYRFKTGI